MNRKLLYNGKTLQQMTNAELEKQVETNTKRIVGNNLFLGAVSVASLIAYPPALIATIGVGAVRNYLMAENNKAIHDELDRR